MVRKRLCPPSSSFCSDCRSWVDQTDRHEGGERLHGGVQRIDGPRQHPDLADRRGHRGQLLGAKFLDLAHLEGELLERRGDHAGKEIDDQDLQHRGHQAEDQQPVVVGLGPAGEIGERRDDEELPVLAELGRQRRQAGEKFLAVMGEGIQALLLARPGAVGERRQLVVQGRDMPQLDAAVVAVVGLRQVGGRDHPALMIENVAQARPG